MRHLICSALRRPMLAFLLLLALPFFVTTQARGSGSGASCVVIVGGHPTTSGAVASTPLSLDVHAPAPVSGMSQAVVTGHQMQVSLAGVTFYHSPRIAPMTPHRWGADLRVDTLGKLGVGIYRFTDAVFGPGGCSRIAYIRLVGRSPFVTPAGAGALLLILLGLALLVLPVLRSRAVRANAVTQLFRGEEVTWRPRPSPMGMVGGMILAGGVVLLLQQFAVVYPTATIAIASLVLGVVIGGFLALPFHRSAVRSAVAEYGSQ